ncbi:hypothetical protein NQ318_013477 [Aromia moschata]|uniref:Tubulin polymerization-promoting protein homolog n=1 Tax=Aromia moschata TaxID=1265417 RepID=A0AAV8YEG5_9CUCU|nr:hypothetical protein NQ318_013477 [Aromia moschata]
MSDEAKPETPTKQLEDLQIENGSGDAKTESKVTFEENFRIFAKFGDPKSDGRQINLSNSDKWMKQAHVIDGKKITTTDTGIYFKKLKSPKLGIIEYRTFLEDLAKNKKTDVAEIKRKLASCGPPGHHGVGAVKSTNTVDRLTDTSKYTGTHKQRFDDVGKGKGIAGRKDLPDTSGYVAGYQNKDTYDKNSYISNVIKFA